REAAPVPKGGHSASIAYRRVDQSYEPYSRARAAEASRDRATARSGPRDRRSEQPGSVRDSLRCSAQARRRSNPRPRRSAYFHLLGEGRGARGPLSTPGDVLESAKYTRRRTDVLWSEQYRSLASCWHLCRQNPQGRETW